MNSRVVFGQSFVRHTGAYGLFFVACLVSSVRHGIRWERVLDEARRLGVGSFVVLATMAVFVGTNLAIQGDAAFSALGAQSLVGMFVALGGVREVCPLLAATMVAAKAGTEMTAQLAVMRSKEQIDAMEVMAIDPRAELVTPSILAILLVLPALTIISIAISIGAAAVVAIVQLGLESGEFTFFLMDNIRIWDLVVAMLKSLVFAGIISTVSGYFGFHSERGPAGVGRATNLAVVTMCVLCISSNFFLSAIFYG
ncbi:MAG: ABC transporter permease [Myxococcota bacterium]|nr:ABC transporter permease [Myxococcota bacterium]